LSKFGRTLTMKNFIPVVFVSLFVLLLGSCLKKLDFPIQPQLEYIGFTQFDSIESSGLIGFVNLKFTDGDGNVGLDSVLDSSGKFAPDSAFENNLFVSIFRKENGEYFPVPVAEDPNVRIAPRLSDEDDQPIEGDIDVGAFIPPRSNTDTAREVTIRWEIYLVDRDLNQSNLIVTPEIVFDR
jgi:hypothetical protein